MKTRRARSPDFWGPVDPIGVQGPDFAEFTLSGQSEILRMAQNDSEGIRMTAWKSFSAACKRPRFSTMYQKQNGLTMDSEDSEKSISLKSKELCYYEVARVTKKRGPQNEGKSHDVIENKWRKNARLWVRHDAIEKKQVIDFLTRC